jgi:hypothetical protein
MFKQNPEINSLEKQIASMLEKVLSDDDNEKLTTFSDGTVHLNTTQDSFEDSPRKFHREQNKRPSLFNKKPNFEFNDAFQGRIPNKRPNTINYGKPEKFTHPLLKNKNENYNNLNENINFIPSDIFSLQLRLKMTSDQNPSKIILTLDSVKFNEYDEVLELKIKPKGEISYDSYLQFKGKFTKVLMTQNGSRVLQAVLKNTNSEIITKVFNEIVVDLNILIVDSYANYFCQKFFNFLNLEERCRFIARVRSLFNFSYDLIL